MEIDSDYNLYSDTIVSSPNLPVIPAFCNIANLMECLVMFYFIEQASAYKEGRKSR